jgi:hypothetical protein
MNKVKWSALAFATAASVLLVGEAWAGGPHTYHGPNVAPVSRSTNNGESVNFSYQNATTMYSLNAYSTVVSGTGAAATAFVAMQTNTNDLTSQVCIPDPVAGQVCGYTRSTIDLAIGDVPLTDLTVTAKGARLTTDLATNPNMYFLQCLSDSVANTYVCTNVAPAGGIIDLTWIKTNDFYYKNAGWSEEQTGPLVVRIIGKSQVYSATVTGSMIGFAVNGSTTGSGVFGTSHTATIDIILQP